VSSGGLLIPHLERALVSSGNTWPEEYAIKIHNKERHWDGFFHPSSHITPAEMQLFYVFHPKYQTHKDSLSVDTIMTFQVGSAYHALVQSMLIHLEFTTPEECEVHFFSDVRHCSGTMDIRKLTLLNGDTLPVEIKSAAFFGKDTTPPPQYIQQLQVYMDLGCEEPQEQGLLLFLQKQHPHKFREILIQRDEKMLNDIYAKWNRVLEAIEFDDPSMLTYPCHERDTQSHRECPARFICRMGPPTGERYPVNA